MEEQDQQEALRRQKAHPPGMRTGVVQHPAPQGRVGQHSGIGYELVLALDVPVLQMAEQLVDASAQAEANDLEVEFMELVRSGFSKSPASLERMREVVRRRQMLHQKARGRKKKRKKRKLPKGSSPRSLPARAVRTRKSGHLSCGSSWCLVSGCCLTSPGLLDYWETTFFDVSVFYAQLGPILDTRTCVSLRVIWDGPLYLAVACSTLSVPEEYSFVFLLGDDFQIRRKQRFLV